MSIPESLKLADQAIALSYVADQHDAPTLVAKGEDDIAQAIIELALAHSVPVYENASLTEWLGQLEIGDEIPAELYQVIAEILAVVYRIQNRTPDH